MEEGEISHMNRQSDGQTDGGILRQWENGREENSRTPSVEVALKPRFFRINYWAWCGVMARAWQVEINDACHMNVRAWLADG